MNIHLLPFEVIVVEEVSVLARVELFGQECEKFVIELELMAHLVPKDVHTVKELQEDLRPVVQVTRRVVPTPFAKHVAKGEPILFNEYLEALECAIVGVQKEL